MHTESLLVGLASVFVLGVGAQWLAAKVRIPSILLLLSTGFIAGPVARWINPDDLLGDLLFPIVSLSVGLILFEGGLSLRFSELQQIGRALMGLLTIGAAVTWALTTVAARWLLGMPIETALVLGAILIVTGPTVIGPLLRYIRPTGSVEPIAKWEGIVIDPIGATLAVLVYSTVWSEPTAGFRSSAMNAGTELMQTLLAGVVCGTVAAGIQLVALRRFWIPDRLQSPVLVALVAAALTSANLWQQESGLLAVTVMGVILANQKSVSIGHIAEFKENLSVLLISCLFILLSARLKVEDLTQLGFRGILFVLCLILVVRPAAVWIGTIGSRITWQERVFLSWFAPRGIVAAAVSSVFAIRLGPAGDDLVPATFVVIVGTVLVYGLTAFPLARRLGLAVLEPQGLLLAGVSNFSRAIAHAVKADGIPVVLLDSNRGNVNSAKLEGLEAVHADLLDEDLVDDVSLGGLGRFLALTSNEEVNALATMRFREVFGSANIYQLAPSHGGTSASDTSSFRVRGRVLFGTPTTFDDLESRFASGALIKRTKLTTEFDFTKFIENYGDSALPLFIIDAANRLTFYAADAPVRPLPGQTLFSLVVPAVARVAPDSVTA